MRRRRFDHLVAELSVLLDRWVARYSLWQAVKDFGYDPESWSGVEAERFCTRELPRWLRNHGHAVAEHRLAKLSKKLARFEPGLTTPEEHFARLGV
jgi:hypothetical protein